MMISLDFVKAKPGQNLTHSNMYSNETNGNNLHIYKSFVRKRGMVQGHRLSGNSAFLHPSFPHAFGGNPEGGAGLDSRQKHAGMTILVLLRFEPCRKSLRISGFGFGIAGGEAVRESEAAFRPSL